MLCYDYRHPGELSIGLSHILSCTGSDSKAVYRQLYVVLKSQGVVFPEWVRAVVRQRFGHHGLDVDAQFEGRPDVYHVTTEDMRDSDWPTCSFCAIPMPDTP